MTDVADGWARCEPNEITNLTRRLRARRQRRFAGGAALLAAVACVAIALWLYPRPDQGPDFAGISCERVMDHSDAYMKKQLAPELQDQIRRHIALCPNCRPMFENMPGISHLRPGHPREPADGARAEFAIRFSRR
jgi:hypothetical protein